MATIKSYTDLEQSKKLAEILPIESADMHYEKVYFEGKQSNWFVQLGAPVKSNDIIPCWSLAALLEQIPSDLLGNNTLTIKKDDSEDLKYGLNYHDRWGREDDIQTKYYDNLVDACYEMIIKLNKKRLL